MFVCVRASLFACGCVCVLECLCLRVYFFSSCVYVFSCVSKLIRDLLALPVRLGGLGLTNPTVISDDNFQSSVKLTAPLVAVIATQDQTLEIDPNDIFVANTEIRASNRQHSEDRGNVIYSQLTPEMKRCVDLTKERGSSSWLSLLPLSEQGFHLH